METAFLIACALLLIGFVLRAKLRAFQVLYVPAGVIGGMLGLAAVYTILSLWGDLSATAPPDSKEWTVRTARLTLGVVGHFKAWPGWLIAVVFAGLLLERKSARGASERAVLALRQGIMVWIICLGQIVLGLAATILVIRPFYEVPWAFGQLIETGFVGGHGTAGAMGTIFVDTLRYPEGADLGYFMATVGLAISVLSGIVYINLAVRHNWVRTGKVEVPILSGLEARENPEPLALARVRSEVLDPLVFQALLLAMAFALGLGLHTLIFRFFPQTENFPKFMYTLIGGYLVRKGMAFMKIEDLIDSQSIQRLTCAAMEFLVVAAITSLNLTAVVKMIGPLSLLVLLGFLWCGICLLVIGRYLLPKDYWFELGLINYGMSTGVTATGFVLLRIVDKDLDSGAAEDYALAAPLSAPFIGGGILTFTLPVIMQKYGAGWPFAALCLALLLFGAAGVLLTRPSNSRK